MPKLITMTSATQKNGVQPEVFTDEKQLAALAEQLVSVEWRETTGQPAKVRVVGLQALKCGQQLQNAPTIQTIKSEAQDHSQATVTDLRALERRRNQTGKG